MGVTSFLALNPYLGFNKLMEQTMMRTHLRVLTALVTIWLAVIGLLALAPETAGTQRADAAGQDHASLNSGSPQRDLAFSHTGLWVAEVGNDGTVAYIREIRRR